LRSLAFFSKSEGLLTYEEASKLSIWKKVIDQENVDIKNNGTWELTELPYGSKRIGVKKIYKTKYNEIREVEKHEARLVVKGYS
jgi:hypothetical protein